MHLSITLHVPTRKGQVKMMLLEIVNEVDKLVLDKAIRNKFTNHIKRLCKMVEDYGQAQQPYSKKLENAEKRIGKFTPKQLEKYKLPNGQIEISLVDVCPPPKGYIKMNYWDNYFINVPLETIYRPKEPVNPLLWFGLFGNSGLQRIPSKSEKLMCDYVCLAIIHDYEIRFSGTPSDRYICSDKDYKGKWFRRDEFFKDIWEYYHYDTERTGLWHLPATDQEKLSQLERALGHVKEDCEKNKKMEKDEKGNKPKGEKKKRKAPLELLKEARERQAVKELAKNPNITCRELGKILDCHETTIIRLKAWKKRGVLSYEGQEGLTTRQEDDSYNVDGVVRNKTNE
jgi:hypothetical protein